MLAKKPVYSNALQDNKDNAANEMPEGDNPNMKKRKPLVAVLLNFPMPGLGQIYNGELAKGGLFFGISLVLSLLLIMVLKFVPGFEKFSLYGFFVLLLLVLAFFIYIQVDACKTARKKGSIPLAWYNKWYFYILFWIVSVVVIPSFPAGHIGKASQVQ